MLILSESDLRSVLTVKDVIDAVDEGFRAIARGQANVPDRLRLNVPDQNGIVLEMPAYLGSGGGEQSALGTKIVSVFERNPSRGLDIIQSAYLLLDSETGVPLSLMDGRFITAIRTAATSAVSTRSSQSTPEPDTGTCRGGRRDRGAPAVCTIRAENGHARRR